MDKKNNARLRLVIAVMALTFGIVCANFVLADSYPAYPTISVSGASTQPYGNVVAVSGTSQAVATVKVSCTQPSEINREIGMDVEWQCSATLSYSATTQPVSWGSPPTGSSATPSPSGWASGNIFTIQAVLNTPGYYKIDLSGSVQAYSEDGTSSYSGTSSVTTVYLIAANISSVTVVSGATTLNVVQNYPHPGDQNWGCVKNATTQAVVEVVTNPDTDDVWKKVVWGGGSAIAGNDNERSYSEANSQKFTVQPSLFGTKVSNPLYIWVIWATVTIDDTQGAANPANAPSFLTCANDYGGNKLGIFYNSTKDAVDFQNCQIAQISPSGVNHAIAGGFQMIQERWIQVFQNITQNGYYWDTGWTGDGPSSIFYTTKPDDPSDKVYAIDNPQAYLYPNGVTQYDEYGNFRDHAEWNSTVCSDHAFWYFEAGVKQSANPEVYFARGSTGQITVPITADPQKAE